MKLFKCTFLISKYIQYIIFVIYDIELYVLNASRKAWNLPYRLKKNFLELDHQIYFMTISLISPKQFQSINTQFPLFSDPETVA